MSHRLVVQSVEGPYVLIELDSGGRAFLERLRQKIAGDAAELGTLGLVVRPFPGLEVRFASGLTSAEVNGWTVLGDPVNEAGPHWLPRVRVTRVHVFEDHFWLYAVDDSDPNHLPEVLRSDSVPFARL